MSRAVGFHAIEEIVKESLLHSCGEFFSSPEYERIARMITGSIIEYIIEKMREVNEENDALIADNAELARQIYKYMYTPEEEGP